MHPKDNHKLRQVRIIRPLRRMRQGPLPLLFQILLQNPHRDPRLHRLQDPQQVSFLRKRELLRRRDQVRTRSLSRRRMQNLPIRRPLSQLSGLVRPEHLGQLMRANRSRQPLPSLLLSFQVPEVSTRFRPTAQSVPEGHLQVLRARVVGHVQAADRLPPQVLQSAHLPVAVPGQGLSAVLRTRQLLQVHLRQLPHRRYPELQSGKGIRLLCPNRPRSRESALPRDLCGLH